MVLALAAAAKILFFSPVWSISLLGDFWAALRWGSSTAFGVSFSGLDYVSHEDILPYSSTDQVPIQHELFERFLMYDQTKGNFWLQREIFRAR